MDAAGVVLLLGLVFWVVIATLVGGLVGSRKGRGGLGALLGFLLGWIGVLIIAIMKPSQQFEEQKSIAQAKVLREALGGGLATTTAPPSTGVVITPEVRQELMLEAIRRDPSLAASSDPETLKRLGETMDALEKEYVLKAELDQLKATQESQAQEAAAVAREQELEAARAQAAAVATEAARVAAAEKALAREAEIAQMSPVRRFVAKNPALAVVIVLVIVAGIAALVFIPMKNSADQEAETAAQVAQARSTACETDIDPESSLIGSIWTSDSTDTTLVFVDTCITDSPGSGQDRLAAKNWSRDQDTVLISTDAVSWTLQVSGNSLNFVSAERMGKPIPSQQSGAPSYTRKAGESSALPSSPESTACSTVEGSAREGLYYGIDIGITVLDFTQNCTVVIADEKEARVGQWATEGSDLVFTFDGLSCTAISGDETGISNAQNPVTYKCAGTPMGAFTDSFGRIVKIPMTGVLDYGGKYN